MYNNFKILVVVVVYYYDNYNIRPTNIKTIILNIIIVHDVIIHYKKAECVCVRACVCMSQTSYPIGRLPAYIRYNGGWAQYWSEGVGVQVMGFKSWVQVNHQVKSASQVENQVTR